MIFQYAKEKGTDSQVSQITEKNKNKNKVNPNSSLSKKQIQLQAYLRVDCLAPVVKISKVSRKQIKLRESTKMEELSSFNQEHKLSLHSEYMESAQKETNTLSTKKSTSSDSENKKQTATEDLDLAFKQPEKQSSKLKSLFKHRFSSKSLIKSLKIKHSISSTIEKNENLYIEYMSENEEKKYKAYSIGFDGKPDLGDKIKFCTQELPQKFWRKNSLELVRKIKKIKSFLKQNTPVIHPQNEIIQKETRSKTFSSVPNQKKQILENAKLVAKQIKVKTKNAQLGMEKYERVNQNDQEQQRRKQLVKKFNRNSILQRKVRKLNHQWDKKQVSKAKHQKKTDPIFMLMSSTF